MMLGVGNRTAGGYVARLADSKVRTWISTVVANPSAGATASAAASTSKPSTQVDLSKLETLDDDDDDGGGDVGSFEQPQQTEDEQPQQQAEQEQQPTQPTTEDAPTQQDTAPAAENTTNSDTTNSASANDNANSNNVLTYQAPDGTKSTYNLDDPAQLKAAQDATGLGSDLQPSAPPSTAKKVLSTVSGWATPAPTNMLQTGPVACICIRG